MVQMAAIMVSVDTGCDITLLTITVSLTAAIMPGSRRPDIVPRVDLRGGSEQEGWSLAQPTVGISISRDERHAAGGVDFSLIVTSADHTPAPAQAVEVGGLIAPERER